ncbi:hypothetical protein MIT9_P1044 [Methylomarinovum caldicuralii]|uniref:DUF1820 domain-containing protein n=1 Tax=Methylomarinovum caldicuralii TaxID=438856 RepID=A0AAU9CIM6_9GAMM|nr:DUF1820 family protein [Methylomarinovum caldicuralii]BCX81466.1 hypothetical protein MIT9_P1044 [Methylomarinovum caldicuralii]
MPSHTLFRVSFVNQNQIYEVYARRVYQADLYGFVVVEEFVFGESSAIVVDPSEEKLKAEFENVQRSFIPMHAVIRIDEVERRGTAKILPMKENGAKVTPLYPPRG